MSSWLTVRSQETISPNADGSAADYLLKIEIVGSGGIEPSCFVYSTHDGRYSHVATVFDLNTYPASYEEAVATGKSFYRDRSATLAFPNTSRPFEAARIIAGRFRDLVHDWAKFQRQPFGGEAVVVYSSDDP